MVSTGGDTYRLQTAKICSVERTSKATIGVGAHTFERERDAEAVESLSDEVVNRTRCSFITSQHLSFCHLRGYEAYLGLGQV